MTPKFWILALAAMSWGAAMTAEAAAVGFEDLAARALADTGGGTFPHGRPLDLVPGSLQVPGFSFTGATVYHVEQTIASGKEGPEGRSHTGFIQNRNSAGALGGEIGIQLTGDLAGRDIEDISFNFALPQTTVRLWAYDTAGKSAFFEFGGPVPSWEWTFQPSFVLDSLGIVNRIAFERQGGGAFALDDLNFTLADTGGGTVPEPAALGLVLLALVSAGVATRKRRV